MYCNEKKILSIVKVEGGSTNNKLPQVIDRSITEITAEDLAGATIIGDGAFMSCFNLTSVTLPNSVTKLNTNAFRGCTNLANVTLPNRIKELGSYAFYLCSALTSIILPVSLTKIDMSAFASCNNLTEITILASTPPTLGSSAISSATTKIFIPAGTLSAYQGNSSWSKYSDLFVELEA